MIQCEKCGVWYGIGAYPFCKGGHGAYGVSVVDDQLDGGPRFFETLGHEPVWIESKSQWKREVDARKESVVHVDRHDAHYYATRRRLHDQELRETGANREY